MKCPRCGKHKAIISKMYGVLPCKVCQAEDEGVVVYDKPEFYTLSKSNRIIEQRDRHARDILQPFSKKGKPNEDFVRAYPDKVDEYFDKKDLKNL